MAAPTAQKASGQAGPKGKKTKSKAVERTESPAPTASPTTEKVEAGPDDGESPYIRDLQKNIRNLTKKITNASKTDAVIAEHPDKSLDDLVKIKVINADQKAQILKKPGLESQLAQLEELLAQYKKVDQDYKTRSAAAKAEVERVLTEKFESEKEAAVQEAVEKLEAQTKQAMHDGFLLLSQFLRLAAARRAEDADPALDENLALEGVLLAMYTGDENAVRAITKLVEGSEDTTSSVSGDPLKTSYAQIKVAAEAYKTPLYSAAESQPADAEMTADAPEADPTVAHAGLTEIAAGDSALDGAAVEPQTNGTAPANATVDNDAANAIAESQWDTGNDMSMSQEWVSVPTNPAELETPLAETAPLAENIPPAPEFQSWADDTPVPVADPNEGFQEIQRRGGRDHHNRDGGHRSRGGRGGRDGRNFGRGRGSRGRGGQGGGSGGIPSRGPRKNEDY